jgi:hypothetical protein
MNIKERCVAARLDLWMILALSAPGQQLREHDPMSRARYVVHEQLKTLVKIRLQVLFLVLAISRAPMTLFLSHTAL